MGTVLTGVGIEHEYVLIIIINVHTGERNGYRIRSAGDASVLCHDDMIGVLCQWCIELSNGTVDLPFGVVLLSPRCCIRSQPRSVTVIAGVGGFGVMEMNMCALPPRQVFTPRIMMMSLVAVSAISTVMVLVVLPFTPSGRLHLGICALDDGC
ncbi:MAG: hypothetical protein IPH49_14805 [Ignavibacteria bacterium]|nr:hypothetical protein [Ignavibacteria bacterium]